MLLSHKYKFIFIKTRKTAGTSTEVDLAKFLGSKDIITAILPPVAGHVAQNTRAHSWLATKLRMTYWNHMPATRVRRIAGRRTFNSYFKFCVEREPVEKCISMYSMLTKSPDFNADYANISWDEYVERGVFPEDAGLYLDDNNTLMVDRIIEYSDLNAGLAQVCGKLGIGLERVETKAKTGFRTPVEVSPKQRQIIYDAFHRSLPHTGYEL